MPFLLHRLSLVVRTRLRGWRMPLAIGVFVFVTSWLLMWLLEPQSGIAAPGTYWWYFLVTAATVGYGDVFPASTGGRVVGAYVIVGGIVTLTALFTQLTTHLQSIKGRRMKGQVQHEARGHVVLLGYTPGRTERIVAELAAEDAIDVVLCASDDVAEHPMPEHEGVRFVRGDLTSAEVMTRSCAADARTVVVDVRDDNETLAIAVAAEHFAPDVRLVATLRDMSRAEHLRYVSHEVQCVQWHMPNLVVEEIQDPGITQVYTDLMTSGGRSNTYSTRLPDALSGKGFGPCQTWFGEHHAATVIAVRQAGELLVSPSWDTTVDRGATVYYLAQSRIAGVRAAGRG